MAVATRDPSFAELDLAESTPARLAVTAAELCATDEGEVEAAIVPCFVWGGAITEIDAPPKAGKTTFELALIAAIIGGDHFLGHPCRQGPVVLISEESRTTLRDALTRAGLHKCVDLHVIYGMAVRRLPWPASWWRRWVWLGGSALLRWQWTPSPPARDSTQKPRTTPGQPWRRWLHCTRLRTMARASCAGCHEGRARGGGHQDRNPGRPGRCGSSDDPSHHAIARGRAAIREGGSNAAFDIADAREEVENAAAFLAQAETLFRAGH